MRGDPEDIIRLVEEIEYRTLSGEAAIDRAVKAEVAEFRCPQCGERNRVHFMAGGTYGGHNAQCDTCGNQWDPPPPWSQDRGGTTYWVKKQMRYEGLVQVKATSPTQALAVARDATTETAEWVEDYPVSTWSVDDAEGRTLIEGDPA